MADGSITGVEPHKAEPAASIAPPSAAQRDTEAVGSADPGKVADAKAKEPIRDLIDKMERVQALVARADAPLASTISAIARQADAPGKLDDVTFRTRVAYALQDIEKLAGPVAGVQPGLREEMTRLAATSPGLQNERMQELLRGTPGIDDRGLVRQIRTTAAEIAREGNQTSPDVQSRVEVLENRARLTTNSSANASVVTQDGAGASRAGTGTPETTPTKDAAAQSIQASERTNDTFTDQKVEQARKQAETPIQPAAVRPDQPQVGLQPATNQGQQIGGPGATVAIMAALRRPEPATPAPWDQQLTPLASRVARYMETAQANRDEAALTAAERSGQEAVKALQAFANGPGAGIMGKIREAAKSDPDGMPGVVAGMREGGPYQDLRRSFDVGLQREKGLAAAVDRTAAVVGQYGRDRTAADGIAAGRADASAITARFEKLDAEIGKAASSTPSRKEGKSQMEELGEKAAELASKAIEAIKAAFKRTPTAEHRAAGPSPSM